MLNFLTIAGESSVCGRDSSRQISGCDRRLSALSRSFDSSTPHMDPWSFDVPSTSVPSKAHAVPAFLTKTFNTECDDVNRPPSLNTLLRSLQQLTSSGSDIRGRFVDHPRLGSIASVAHAIGRLPPGSQPPLTPLAAHCFGHALAQQLLEHSGDDDHNTIEIVIGQDPRLHGMRLADALARGAESANPTRIRVLYTGLATTPACASFLKLHGCQAAVMVTASHLPPDRNGFKIFYPDDMIRRMTQRELLEDLGARAMDCANAWYNAGLLPPSSGNAAVMCSQHVQYMPAYLESLKQAIIDQANRGSHPLQGFKIVLNAGNGAGGCFQQVLTDLGADPTVSIHLVPDGNFPNQVPNPEYAPMIQETVKACEEVHADLGIMLDTDADRCGFVAPSVVEEDGTRSDYQPLNRNRLIALLGVMFAESSPGCAFVTDSVTSEGLATFLQDTLGLVHVRYLKGYANVIGKARELTESGELNAEVAIETSGHCALKENDYLDDGTYTAAKVLVAMARQSPRSSLLDLISSMEELDEIAELRMNVKDESLDTLREAFDVCQSAVETLCESKEEWEIDRENLEGIRVRVGKQNQFMMLRKSLHDPVISLQLEVQSKEEGRKLVVEPLVELISSHQLLRDCLDTATLEAY